MTMSRPLRIVAFAVFASLLMVTALPVGAANVAMVSQHVTGADLGAGSLSNAEVEASGDRGVVGHDTARASAVSRYAFDAGTGSTAFDHVGSNDGSVSGASWTAGVSGQALNFDGAGDFVDIGDTSTFNFGTGGFTVSFWVKSTSSRRETIIHKSNDAGNDGWYVDMRADGTIRFLGVGDGQGNTAFLDSSDVINDGNWHFVSVSRESGTDLSVYIDGVKQGGTESVAGSPSIVSNTVQPRVGDAAWTESNDFTGAVDDPRIYSSALSPGLVRRLYASPAAKLSATASERWGLDAGTGSTAYGDEGNNGTITGASWVSGQSGQALNFNENSDTVTISDFSGLNLSGDFTITGWVKPVDSSADRARWLIQNDSSSLEAWQFQYRPDYEKFEFFIRDDDGDSVQPQSSVGSAPLGVWTMATVVRDNDTVTLYVNGSVAGSLTESNLDIVNPDQSVAVSGAVTNTAFNGTIDDLRFYNRALTQSDISWLYRYPGAQLNESSTYTSTDHAVTHSVSGYTDLVLENASATVTWTNDAGTTLNQSTYTASGNHSLTWAEDGTDAVNVSVAFEATAPDHTARLLAEGVTAQAYASEVDDSSLAPNSSTTIESGATLDVAVSDADFGAAQGDSVTVEFYVDGTLYDSDSLSANGTASVSASSILAGEHTWHVVASDTYGHSVTSATATVSVPSSIEIRNESEPHSLVTSTAAVEVTIAGSDETVAKREITNGVVNMSGLDATQAYVVQVDAEGYHTRSIYLNSLYDQASVFVLNTSLTSVENTFVIVDNTGQFNDRPKLIVEKIVNRSLYDSSANGYEWTTITGDRLGATNSMIVDLEQDARYRLKVLNTEGDVRSLGEYVASAGGLRELTIGSITWPQPGDSRFSVDAYAENVSGTLYLKFVYSDVDENTTSLTLRVHEQGNASNQIYSATQTDLGNYTDSVALPANGTWVANYTVERGGETFQGVIPVGKPGELPLPIEEKWLTPLVYLALVGLMAATPSAAARTGAVAVVGVGIVVWWFGWVPLSGPALAVAGSLALIGKAADYAEAM